MLRNNSWKIMCLLFCRQTTIFPKSRETVSTVKYRDVHNMTSSLICAEMSQAACPGTAHLTHTHSDTHVSHEEPRFWWSPTTQSFQLIWFIENETERRRYTPITYNDALLFLKAPVKSLSTVLGKSNLQFSGMNIKLTVSTCSLILMNLDNQQVR